MSLKPNVSQPKRLSSQNDRISAPVRALARGDLLDHIDNAAPKLGVGNAGDGTGQGQPLRRREEIGNIGGRSAVAESACARDAARSSLEQERDRHLQYFGDLLNTAGADPVGAL